MVKILALLTLTALSVLPQIMIQFNAGARKPSTGGSGAAFSYVNSIHAANAGIGNVSATLTWTPTIGDVLVVGVDCWSSASGPCILNGVSDVKGNIYTQLIAGGHATNVTEALFCAPVSATQASLVVTSSQTQTTGGDSDITVTEYAGLTCTTDGTAVAANDNSSATGTLTAGAITTTNATDLIIGYGTASTGADLQPGSGYIMRQNTSTAAELFGYEDHYVTATGSYTATETSNGTPPWGFLAVALKAGAVTPTLPTFAYVNSTHAANAGIGNVSATLSWTPAVGNVLEVGVDCWSSTGSPCAINSITDGKGNVYASMITGGHNTNVTETLFCAPVTSTQASLVVTANLTQAIGGDSDITVAEYAGLTCTADGTAVAGNDNSSATGTLTAGSITTTNATDLLIGYGTASTGANLIPGTGYTMRQNTSTSAELFGFEDQYFNATGTYTPTMTSGTTPPWGFLAVAQKAGSGGTTGGGGGGTGGPPPNSVTLASICSAGTGGDDTSCIQGAWNSTASSGKTLEMQPPSSGLYNVQPLTTPDGLSLYLDSGVTIQATVAGYSGQNQVMIDFNNHRNVTMTGTPGHSGFQMRKSQYTDGSEYRHCLNLVEAHNITVTGIFCNSSGGDGAYVNGVSGINNIVLTNDTFNNNSRDGLSIISVNGLTIDGCTFSNTVGNPNNGSATGGPWDGIDVEPNGNNDHLQNIQISNSTFTGNGRPLPSGDAVCSHCGNAITIAYQRMDNTDPAVSITMTNLTSNGNLGSGYFITNGVTGGVSAPGTITLTNSTTTGEGQWGIVCYFCDYDPNGSKINVQGNTITNPMQQFNTLQTFIDAGLAMAGGGGETSPAGNFTAQGTSIIYTSGINYPSYFNAGFTQPGSPHQIFINNFGTTSGLGGGKPFGLLQGSSVTAVNIN